MIEDTQEISGPLRVAYDLHRQIKAVASGGGGGGGDQLFGHQSSSFVFV